MSDTLKRYSCGAGEMVPDKEGYWVPFNELAAIKSAQTECPVAGGDAVSAAEDSQSAAGGSPAFQRWVKAEFGEVHPGDLSRLRWAFEASVKDSLTVADAEIKLAELPEEPEIRPYFQDSLVQCGDRINYANDLRTCCLRVTAELATEKAARAALQWNVDFLTARQKSTLEECETLYQTAQARLERAKKAEAERDALREEMRQWAKEAVDDVSSWGEYAGDYFKAKWNLAGDIKKWQDRLDAAEWKK